METAANEKFTRPKNRLLLSLSAAWSGLFRHLCPCLDYFTMNFRSLFTVCRNAYVHTSCVQRAVKNANPAIAGLGAKKGKAKQENTKITLAVETDAKKLVNYVCGSNLMQTGEDVQIKPDNEYPDWLWSVHTGPVKKLEELEPGSKEYLEKLKRINIKKALRLQALSKIKQQ